MGGEDAICGICEGRDVSESRGEVEVGMGGEDATGVVSTVVELQGSPSDHELADEEDEVGIEDEEGAVDDALELPEGHRLRCRLWRKRCGTS